MTTVRDICTRALRRAGLVGRLETPPNEESVSALNQLNEMMFGWAVVGVDTLMQSAWALDDTFRFWVPPVALVEPEIASVSYQGTWNASTNTPTLASATGTAGYVYRVTVAGSTALDDVSSWSVDDWAVFNGEEWLKSIDSTRFEGGIISMLAVKLADEFREEIPAQFRVDANKAWQSIVPYYVKPPLASFDLALRDMPSRNVSVTREEW